MPGVTREAAQTAGANRAFCAAALALSTEWMLACTLFNKRTLVLYFVPFLDLQLFPAA